MNPAPPSLAKVVQISISPWLIIALVALVAVVVALVVYFATRDRKRE